MLEMFTDADPMRSDDYSLPADGWRQKNNANEIGGFMDIGKLRVMNLGTVADELEQLRAYKAAIESQVPVGLVKTIGGYPDESEHRVDWLVRHHQLVDGQDLYANPVPPKQPAQITDEMISKAMGVVIGYFGEYGTHNDYLSKEAAREVLEAALSVSEQKPDDISAQKLWDYYQTLLKHYGFEGITDLLSKYRKLAEQVPEVVVPENMVELLTKAILFQDCGSHEGWEDNIDLGKAALKVFTASLMTTPSHSQQSAGDWLPVSVALPPEGEPFQAFHESWVDEDFNVYGIRECHRYGDGTQYASAKWLDHQDCWIEDSEVPQLWRPYVKPDRCPSHESEQLAGLVEALETALFGTPLDDVPNRDNDDIWRMCYPHLPERASGALRGHLARIETALAAYRKGEKS